ncbi:MAG: sterol desaturase/sphingolipid hydroxylase (fatty acid hydroxylase superfamily) [Halieaceae bacterium]
MLSPYLPTYVLLVGCVCAFLWEGLWPRRAETSGLGRRWLNNFTLTGIGLITAHGCAALTPMATAWFAQHYQLGLLSNVDMGLTTAFLLTLLAYELMGYVIHMLFHNVPWLWRIHTVHHSDVELDVSTTYRHHPFEIAVTFVITLPVILLLSPPVLAVLLYQSIRSGMHVIAHSNLYIPKAINRWLVWFIVTPDFHRLHHCSERGFTNSNYGTILPWFDYLFGTATRRDFDEQETMEIGLEYARSPRDSRIDQMLLIPFRDSEKLRYESEENPV